MGRLKHERVEVPRERLLDWAYQVMALHADRKSILEVITKIIFDNFEKLYFVNSRYTNKLSFIIH